ncbi:hypothetical protein [Halapricum desulfuricans]|nr:hypothetical protein [Halapricum desulfuricans]
MARMNGKKFYKNLKYIHVVAFTGTKMEQSRRAVIAMGVTTAAGLAGCATISSMLERRKARVQTSNGGGSQSRYIKGQPTFEATPAAEGWLVTDPEWMEDNIRWDHLEGEELSLRRIQGNLNAETFLTVFVGALPFGYGLGDYRDAHLENRTIHVYAEATETSVGGVDDPNDPEYTYDYSFILWRLLDDAKPPTEMDFNFRLGALSADTATETAE